jgi:hypothetical protein
MSIGSYYAEAIPRAFLAGWDWMLSEGILLTLLLAFALLVWAIGFASFRAFGRRHSWADAMTEVRKAARDFGIAGIAATGLALAILFVVFFVRDAPTQLLKASDEIQTLKRELSQKPSGEFTALFLWPDSGNSRLKEITFNIVLDNSLATTAIITDLRIVRLATLHFAHHDLAVVGCA